MGWLDTMTPKPGGSRHCSDDYMYMVHGAYVVAEADDKTVYFSAKYSSKCYNGIPPEERELVRDAGQLSAAGKGMRHTMQQRTHNDKHEMAETSV